MHAMPVQNSWVRHMIDDGNWRTFNVNSASIRYNTDNFCSGFAADDMKSPDLREHFNDNYFNANNTDSDWLTPIDW